MSKDLARDCKNEGNTFPSGNFPRYLEISELALKQTQNVGDATLIPSGTRYYPWLDEDDGQIVETLVVPCQLNQSPLQDSSPTSLPSESDKDSGVSVEYNSRLSAKDASEKVETDTDASEFSDEDEDKKEELRRVEVRPRTPFQRKVWNRRNGRYRVRNSDSTNNPTLNPGEERVTQSSIHDQLINLRAEIAMMKQEIADMNEESETDEEAENEDEVEDSSRRALRDLCPGSEEEDFSYFSDFSSSENDYLENSGEEGELSEEEDADSEYLDNREKHEELAEKEDGDNE